MTTKLTEDQVRELERYGDQPMPLEHPVTHEQYLLVPVQRIGLVHRGEWTESHNARRFELIDKDIAGTLTPEEAVELCSLNSEMDRILDEMEPLPSAKLRAIHDQLLRRSRLGADQP